jgi:hypothetical protein
VSPRITAGVPDRREKSLRLLRDPQILRRKGMGVAVFATGGAFDKEYNELKG